jgi:hypothetical protein
MLVIFNLSPFLRRSIQVNRFQDFLDNVVGFAGEGARPPPATEKEAGCIPLAKCLRSPSSRPWPGEDGSYYSYRTIKTWWYQHQSDGCPRPGQKNHPRSALCCGSSRPTATTAAA